MLRVRENPTQANLPAAKPIDTALASAPAKRSPGRLRLAAMSLLGLALGAGGAVLTVSMVQAEDDAGIRAFFREEAARRAERQPQRAAYGGVTAYAPARNGWSLPLFNSTPDGRIAHPPVVLNPFKRQQAAEAPRRQPRHTKVVGLDTVSGAADTARTICVRMCDGFHAPIGYLRAQSDVKAHEALCQAMNPGIPVKVFRVPAGAASIDGAVAQDGRTTYGSLPVAYGHEKSADPACRPAIVAAGERRVSLLRDITLRPGDSVVLDGRVRTFTGGTRWPYSTRDFEDFRGSRELSASQRRMIDETVGISRREAQMQALRRQMRTREAALRDDNLLSDALPLRGTLEPQVRGPVRVIALP
ncbi:DUF2865 domain-containing protein [Bosea caraganae]|uniref:DUF2865 domain-containing protein n=1 Tax=Bosea caraganae TaxID=2763117 RepID=A0A370LCJ2_9HYPH|nr:DUF2865 domain-containing protein [Bosea caraganae]RDJ27671.1 DUF2865 domain-containing protein [Bosea caraganae]RDJ29684.1 DUF2865 domain-containing protein [Bosea caraganae]